MPKPSTKAVRTSVIDPETGLQVVAWEKTCIHCGKKFVTTSRTQKFCTTECGTKYNKRRKAAKKAYDATKEYARIKSRAHSLGVEVLRLLGRLNVCECCGSEKGPFEVHHKNLNWLDNTPDNLECLCTKCHHAAHSAIDAANKDKTPEEIYGSSFPIIEPTLK